MDVGFPSITKAAPDLENLGQSAKDKAKKKQKENIEVSLPPATSGILAQEADRAAMLKAGVGPEVEAAAPATDGVYHPEADRAAMLREGAAVPVPVPEVVPPAAPEVPPAGAIEPVASAAGSPPAPPMTDVRAAQYAPQGDVTQQALQDPDAVEKIAKIAKKRGRGILDALQAGLYGFAGINKETDFEKAQTADAKAAEQAQDQAFAQMMAGLDQKNADRRQELEHQFQMDVAQARNQWDTTAAERGYQMTAEQNKLNRQSDLEIAKERWVQAAVKAGKAPADALKEFQAQLSKMYGG